MVTRITRLVVVVVAEVIKSIRATSGVDLTLTTLDNNRGVRDLGTGAAAVIIRSGHELEFFCFLFVKNH